MSNQSPNLSGSLPPSSGGNSSAPASAPPTTEEIRAWLVAQLADILYIDPSEIDVCETFNSFGLSSRDAVLLSGDLEDWLNCRLSPTIVYEYPTIEALAGYLRSEVLSLVQVEESPAEVEPEGGNLDSLLSQLEQLSEEEAEALLLEKLANLDEGK